VLSDIWKKQRQAGFDIPAPGPRGKARALDYGGVKELYLTGVEVPEIAAALGATRTAIDSAIHYMRKAGEHIPYRIRTRAVVTQLPTQAEQDTAQAAKPCGPICMSCRKPAPSDSPRWFVCTDCKVRDAGAMAA
jgi:biotin operon repressor